MNRLPLTCLFLVWAACTGGEKNDDTGAQGDTGESGDTGTTTDAVCTDPVEPSCIDDMILDLSLQATKTSDGEVVDTPDGADFVTTVDASAGGYNNADKNAWTYVSFSADGTTKVDIDDESALESMEWDLAFKRYIIRVNSGDSGPSCVGAATMSGTTYADVTSIPAGTSYAQDDFYSGTCELKDDGSGLPGSPPVALHDWWAYPSRCVQMSGTPFLVQKADGHVFKMLIEAYYGEEQAECDENGSTTADGGFFIVRWQMMN